MTTPPQPGPVPERYAYFMMRVRAPAAGEAAALSGLIERMHTGEKEPFADSVELVRLVRWWLEAR